MPSGRSTKRARKKQHRNARRVAFVEAVRRRRRQRLVVLGISVALVGTGVGVAFLARSTGPANKTTTVASPETKSSAPAPTPKPVACDAKMPSSAGSRKQTYGRATDQHLDPDNTYLLRLETSCGDIDIELDVDNAPKTANSVVFLAREHFYDGLVFHRVEPGFVVQGGDPQGDGSGGPGYQVVEAPPKDTKYVKGVVAMAKTQADPAGSSGSQFFIVSGDDARLPPEYAILGEVSRGQDVVERIEKVGRAGQPPKAFAYIERATVIEE
jgi:peptidyl-prolyl cis-trans isomerase B (cyclophilin B)